MEIVAGFTKGCGYGTCDNFTACLLRPTSISRAYRIIMDLGDCFYAVSLHPGDCERFSFSELAYNFGESMKRHYWEVLHWNG